MEGGAGLGITNGGRCGFGQASSMDMSVIQWHVVPVNDDS
jgi:hypothetical protein